MLLPTMSFLCYICHNTVHSDTNADTREKYKELVGMRLCSDSHLCQLCCHLLRKLWLFKSICLKRSMEYPVLFSDNGPVNLQNSNIETINLCPDSEECELQSHTNYNFAFEDNIDTNRYVSLEDKTDVINATEIENDDNDDNKSLNNDEINDDASEFDDKCDNEQETRSVEENKESTAEAKDKEELNEDNDFIKIILTVEEQKAELEAKRREDKYLEAEFKCYNCAMGFLFKDTHQAHMMRHEESNGEHLCPICLLRFASGGVLRAHVAAHRERHACARCGRAVRPRRRAAHRASCAPHHPAMCHRCSKGFADAHGLQQHIKRFHLSKTSSKTYSCHVCGKTYNNQAAVRTHMIKHINKKFTCDQCPSTFSSPYTLTQHRKRHEGTEQPQQCEACNITYATRKSLLAHYRNALCHQVTVLVCPICSRTCANHRSLAAHMQTVHTTEKPYSCPQCPMRYSSNKSLARHRREHRARAERRVCHRCGAGFWGNNKLNRHLRNVCEKNITEEEPCALYNQELQ